MDSKTVVILGAGGFGRETLMLIRDISASKSNTLRCVGFLDDAEPDRNLLDRLGTQFLGSPRDPAVLAQLPRESEFTIATGSGQTRQELRKLMTNSGFREALLVHPTALIGEDVVIESGVVCAGSVVTTNVRMGHSTQINLTCTIGHDVVFGDCVTLSPGVNVSGNVTIGSRSTIYSNAVVLPGVKVGDDAVVGAGAVVHKDVADSTTVVGVPAQPTTVRGDGNGERTVTEAR